MPALREAIRPARLSLGEDDDGRHYRKDYAANREERDHPRPKRRSLAALDGPLDRAIADHSDDEQGARQKRVATPEHNVRRRRSTE